MLFLFLISSFPFFLTRSNSFFFFSFFFFSFFPELEQSSAGLIALLDDPEKKIQEYALKKLNEVIDEFWAEISDAIEKMSVSIAIFFSFSLSTSRILRASRSESCLEQPDLFVSFTFGFCSEILFEDQEFGSRNLAALVASKVSFSFSFFLTFGWIFSLGYGCSKEGSLVWVKPKKTEVSVVMIHFSFL